MTWANSIKFPKSNFANKKKIAISFGNESAKTNNVKKNHQLIEFKRLKLSTFFSIKNQIHFKLHKKPTKDHFLQNFFLLYMQDSSRSRGRKKSTKIHFSILFIVLRHAGLILQNTTICNYE
jgi:hypothetical protein